MILEALIPIMQDAGIATEGVDLFIHFMPASVTSGVLILPALAGTMINPQLPGYRNNDSVQVICREPNVKDAIDRAQRVRDALIIQQRTLLPAVPGSYNDIWMNYFRPRHDPLPYPRQPSGGWEVSTNFVCSYATLGGKL